MDHRAHGGDQKGEGGVSEAVGGGGGREAVQGGGGGDVKVNGGGQEGLEGGQKGQKGPSRGREVEESQGVGHAEAAAGAPFTMKGSSTHCLRGRSSEGIRAQGHQSIRE